MTRRPRRVYLYKSIDAADKSINVIDSVFLNYNVIVSISSVFGDGGGSGVLNLFNY